MNPKIQMESKMDAEYLISAVKRFAIDKINKHSVEGIKNTRRVSESVIRAEVETKLEKVLKRNTVGR
jgi:hypothetical protein